MFKLIYLAKTIEDYVHFTRKEPHLFLFFLRQSHGDALEHVLMVAMEYRL
jgi:hypothetical protein